jgi:hypothetical protein
MSQYSTYLANQQQDRATQQTAQDATDQKALADFFTNLPTTAANTYNTAMNTVQGIPDALKAQMLKQGGADVTAQAQKYGILDSGSTVNNLENMASNIQTQDVSLKNALATNILNSSIGGQTSMLTGLENRSYNAANTADTQAQQTVMDNLNSQYEQAIADKDYERAAALQQQTVDAQSKKSSMSGLLGGLGGIIGFFTGGPAGAAEGSSVGDSIGNMA